MKTLTFVPEQGHYRVKELGWLCSLPKIKKVVTIENYSVGCGHSAHPNIDATGSIAGMKKLGYWREDAKTHQQGGFIYNISAISCSNPLEELCLSWEMGTAFVTVNPNGEIIHHYEPLK